MVGTSLKSFPYFRILIWLIRPDNNGRESDNTRDTEYPVHDPPPDSMVAEGTVQEHDEADVPSLHWGVVPKHSQTVAHVPVAT